jgi:hypothetical protein
MNTRRFIMENVSVKNELSSRPERSEVEGPAVPLTSIQFDRKSRLFIRSSLTCLRQVSPGMNNVSELVITAITPNGSASLPFVIPSTSTCLRQVEGKMNEGRGLRRLCWRGLRFEEVGRLRIGAK